MNKFNELIQKLSAVSMVVDTVEYYIKDCEDDINRYKEQIKESSDNEEYYNNRIAEIYTKEAVWIELRQYLEKKYIR